MAWPGCCPAPGGCSSLRPPTKTTRPTPTSATRNVTRFTLQGVSKDDFTFGLGDLEGYLGSFSGDLGGLSDLGSGLDLTSLLDPGGLDLGSLTDLGSLLTSLL